MKPLVLALAFLLASTGAEDLAPRYEAGLEIRVVSESKTTMTLEAMTLTFDGDPAGGEESDESEQVTTRSMEYVDTVVSVDEGRRTSVRRAFETLHQVDVGAEGETEESGVLEGRVILLEGEDEGDVTATLDDDGDPVDDLYLEGFLLSYDTELLLPDEAVEPGDSWTVEGEAARRYFGLTESVTWFAEEDAGEEDDDFDFEALFAEELGGEVTVTFVGPLEDAGEEVLAFTFELEMEGALDGLRPEDIGLGGDEEGNPFEEGEIELEATVEGSGSFQLDPSTHRLRRADGSGAVDLELTMTADLGGHELQAVLEFEIEIEGETLYTED